jgi:hypothetical protein
MTAAKVLTVKKFSMQSLKNTMMAAWNPARDVSFNAIEENLFVLQALCLGDWNKIMEEGPWLFRWCALMVEPFDGSTVAPTIIPKGVQAWIQIHKIPPLFRNKDVLDQLARRVGTVIRSELAAVPTGAGVFHRVRVVLDSAKPLTRFVPLVLEGHDRIFLQIKYEKLPKFCDHCGLMGHNYMECGTREYDDSKLQFGTWMLSDESLWRPGTPGARVRQSGCDMGSARGRGSAFGRGGGRAGREPENRDRRKWVTRGGANSRKQNSGEAGLEADPADDLNDTASSPLKNALVDTSEPADSGARKKLDMELGEELIPPPPPAYVSLREQKKQKKAANGKDKVNSTYGESNLVENPEGDGADSAAAGRRTSRSNELPQSQLSWDGGEATVKEIRDLAKEHAPIVLCI